MSLEASDSSQQWCVPVWVQIAAWLFGVAASIAGMTNLVAEWNMELATVQFLLLAIAPVAWLIQGGRSKPNPVNPAGTSEVLVWGLAVLVGLTAFGVSLGVGWNMQDLPPAYHDEYSYLFQARTLLQGAFSAPSHSTHPELFNQMHVLNEGRMASRYYPGTGFWLAPFVALNHPYWGQWLATSIAAMFVFWTGYELGRMRVAVVSGFAFAVSPGVALFSNLLLAHQSTLLGLSLFLWVITKWQRTHRPREAFIAGCGLSFAMLCRPVTAAGFGLPFGLAMILWFRRARSGGLPVNWGERLKSLTAIGLPLVAGWCVMIAYNQSVTGSWRVSPYQLYTDIYTPRHVYGFNNVSRGEQKLGPKVIDNYDRWALNLTPELAVSNSFDRWISSWVWIFDVLPLLMSFVILIGTMFRVDRRWITIGLAILSLHAIHVPYWYTGIMGWHYVFETSPLWCLVLGLATDLAVRSWRTDCRWLMSKWWGLFLFVSLAGNYLPFRWVMASSTQTPRILPGVRSIAFPRNKYHEFDQWLDANVTMRPALVLIEVDPNDTHMDYVINRPGLDQPILRARYRRDATDLQAVIAAFPGRSVYLCQPNRTSIELLRGIEGSGK